MKIDNLKDMLIKTKEPYANKIAYKLRNQDGTYTTITHKEVRETIDACGTALIDMGLKDKRIAVIGENRYEWEISYLSVVCGTGVVVPLDKALPENELAQVIEKSEAEAIFCSGKYVEALERIRKSNTNNLKYIISFDLKQNQDNVYSLKQLINTGNELVKNGDKRFIDAKINSKEMSIMLFTSGTTSKSKIVALSHENLCANLMAIDAIHDIDSNDIFLSILPVHHVFECTVGFLFALYKGSQTVFSDGMRHIIENMKEYKVSVMACVPAIYERMLKNISKKLDKEGKLEDVLARKEKAKNCTMEEKRDIFSDIHEMLGENVRLLISGAASLDNDTERRYRELGLNIVQGYGLTETSPVIGMGCNKYYKLGSVGKAVPGVEAKILKPNKDGVGELLVRGKSIMLGYYDNKKATKEVFTDDWFHTGDLARIDDEGYIFICGRKKSVIVLKNGKNIYPEELENLVNKIDGVNESFIYGKQKTQDKEDVKVNVKIVFDREIMKTTYNAITDQEIYFAMQNEIKKINKIIPKYKAIRGIILSEEPLIKTTTNKIKRQDNLNAIT